MTRPDDHNDDWTERPSQDDTAVDLSTNEDLELDEASPTPPRGVETLAGYDLGRRDERMAMFQALDSLFAEERRRGHAEALHAVRDHMLDDGASPGLADVIIRALAARIGVKLG